MTPVPAALGLTLLALVCFAANSLLARAALRGGAIDPASYTAIRLASGALVLVALVWLRRSRSPMRGAGSWLSALALFLYAAPFSFAYVALPTGTGALILFGVVQMTMIGVGVARGVRPTGLELLGLVVAFGGLIWLVLPGIAAPDPLGASLMAAAGVAWGVYSLRGRGAPDPLAATADNFARTVPAAVVLVAVVLIVPARAHASIDGVLLACASGAIASGLGYSIWYTALRYLKPTRAAIVQLAVPGLAALAGVVVLGEELTLRMLAAGTAIVGGIAIAIAQRATTTRSTALSPAETARTR